MKNSLLQKFQWQILAVLWVISLGMGMNGFARYAAWNHQANHFWDNFYLTIQLIPMNSGAVAPPLPWELEIARFLFPLLTGATALKALWEGIRKRIHASRLAHLSGHMIICGLSRKGFTLAKSFRQQGRMVVVIERNEENDWLEACRASGVYVLLGDAAEPILLTRAGVQRAEALFAVSDDDGTNAAIALQAEGLVKNRSEGALKCLAHIDDPRLCALLYNQNPIFENRPFQLILFNVFERGALRLAQEHPAWDAMPTQSPHILIIGLGRFGQNLVIHLARSWWNFRPEPTWKLSMTVIDRHATEIVELLKIRYPQLAEAVVFLPQDMDVRSPEFERVEYLRQISLSRIYICLDHDSLTLQTGIILQGATGGKVPIVMRMSESGGLDRLVGKAGIGVSENLFPFNILDWTCSPDLLHMQVRDILAKAFHEEFVRTQRASGALAESDPSMQPWDCLDRLYRTQNYQQVDHLFSVAREYGYSIIPLVDWNAPSATFPPELVGKMAQRTHELWMEDRLAGGWRYLSGEKNIVKKTSPALLPWDGLSEGDRMKNFDFIRSIPVFLSQIGYQVEKANS